MESAACRSSGGLPWHACAITEAKNACAGSITCENSTGHRACLVASSLSAIGSLAATLFRSFIPTNFSTTNITPIYRRLVAAAAFLRLRRLMWASSSAAFAEATAPKGEADPPLRKVERVVLNALGPIPWDEILTARGRWLRQPREGVERARRKFPA